MGLDHKGIAQRSFKRNFTLSDDIVVQGSRMENGMLYIELERIIPEEKKPKTSLSNKVKWGEKSPLDWVNTSMDTEVEIKQTDKLDISKPKKYSVILYNDESTPMEFVVELLVAVFHHSEESA